MAASRKITETTGTPLPTPGDPNVFYVIDLSGYVFRAYHAVAPLSNQKGEPTHAVYGTTQMINLLVRERKPAYLAIAMDSRKGSARKEIYADYKATRQAPPPDLAQQMLRCEQIARAYGIPIFQKDGIEADDLIAALALRLRTAHPDLKVVVVSSDKDLMQLVDDKLVLFETMRNKVYGPNEVQEKFGVPPSKVRDVLALMGDSSDNIPGAPGVGPKTAAELIAQFGDIPTLYSRLEEVKRPKLRDSLYNAKADVELSQRLVTLDTNHALDVKLEDLAWSPPDPERAMKLRAIFTELEFGRLADALEIRSTVVRATRALMTKEALAEFVAGVGQGPLAVLPLSTAHRPHEGTLIGIGLSHHAGDGVYLPIAHRYLGNPAQVPLADVRAILGPLLADPGVKKVSHDWKLAYQALKAAGLPAQGLSFDALLGAYLLDPEVKNGLAELAQSELGVTLESEDVVTRKDVQRKGQRLSFEEVPIEDATRYQGTRADVARELCERQAGRVTGANLDGLLRDLELPLTEQLAEMELTGVKVDLRRLAQIQEQVATQIRSIEERARELVRAAGGPADDFNCGSPKQVEHVLFDVLHLPVLKRTKTSRSTDADVLEELDEKHPLAGVILEHRALHKLQGTYLEALPRLVNPKTGRVHTTYQQHVAATGRISSADPNLQNIPIRTEIGRSIRAAFVAEPGHAILSCDYSQIELRILAHLSGDPILIEAFRKGEDIHTRTARELFMDGADGEPTKEMRRRAKAVNFGVVYGQGENALAKNLGIPREEAAEFISRYFQRYEGVRAFMQEQIEVARRGEGVHTLLGRRRFLPDIHSPNRALRAQAERMARNTPIQGTAADVLKLAMLALRTPPVPGARMILTVHDELVFEVPLGREEEAAAVVKQKMSGVASLAVPLAVDAGWGADWASAK